MLIAEWHLVKKTNSECKKTKMIARLDLFILNKKECWETKTCPAKKKPPDAVGWGNPQKKTAIYLFFGIV